MAEHTRGPWRVTGADGGMLSHMVLGPIGEIIARYSPWSGDPKQAEEGQANARLIAAAPDLLAACKAVEKQMKNGYINPDQCLDWLAAAIAKARGGEEKKS